MAESRMLALEALTRWRRGREFADKIVAESFARFSPAPSDRGFALELFYGVLRNLTLLDYWISLLRSAAVDPGTRDLLRLGLYQVMFLETAPHAAVFETVKIARPHARPVVNAILRRALREKAGLTNAAEAQPLAVRFSHPEFLVEKWTRQFGAEAAGELCRWNNLPAPVYARVNRLQTSVPEFLERYPESSLLPERGKFVRLTAPGPVGESGDGYIQDPSTAIACELLAPQAGETVLDACAAPGGKAAYLAEMMQNKGNLVAAERDEARLARLRENLVRLKIGNARIVVCDWSDEASVRQAGFERQSFEKILVDVPCTNTGVMRRRVDVRWRLQPEDFARMAQEQGAILRAVAPLLKSGGSLVYSTCSLEPEENQGVVEAFVREEPEFSLTKSEESLPFRDGFDGAYAAHLSFSGRLHHSTGVE